MKIKVGDWIRVDCNGSYREGIIQDIKMNDEKEENIIHLQQENNKLKTSLANLEKKYMEQHIGSAKFKAINNQMKQQIKQQMQSNKSNESNKDTIINQLNQRITDLENEIVEKDRQINHLQAVVDTHRAHDRQTKNNKKKKTKIILMDA